MHSELTIESNVNELCQVELYLNSIFKEFKFSRKTFCKMYLSITEAVNNAIIHGNGLDPNKKVSIQFIFNNSILEFIITDEGEGFIPELIPDPTLTQNLKKESGRGIFLMKQYADQLEFSNDGKTIKLFFKDNGN